LVALTGRFRPFDDVEECWCGMLFLRWRLLMLAAAASFSMGDGSVGSGENSEDSIMLRLFLI
jgi:hypothetical protein